MQQPNILYIHTHDTGRYVQPYGYRVPTPNLMALARESTLFRQAFCAAPTCSPSRVAMLSGMAPHSSQMLGLAHRGFQMNDYSRHLASYLGTQGYHTALCGVQHEAPDSRMIGYEQILQAEAGEWWEGGDDRTNAHCVGEYIRCVPKDRPFFLSFGMLNTHRKYPQHGEYVNPDYVQPAFPLYDNAANRADMADFMRSAQIADECVGEVLRALDEAGLRENTVVLSTTDHGIAMPFMKCSLYDTGIGVSLMLRYPGNPSAGKATDALVSHLDVFPTLCDLAGIPKPEWLQGQSLLPVLKDTDAKVNEEIFGEVTYHAAYEPARCTRTQRYKLIRYYDFHNGYVPANIDASPAKDLLLSCGLLGQTRAQDMLFDLWMDPVERVNLAQDARYGEVYNDLSRRLYAWMERTDDPLLHVRHRVPAPLGAKVNPLSCVEPNETDFE
ncbi:MAG: sulfatase [Eubacteriales bacterium]|nr:sulfatase [Eubacteriales bacterium]